MNDLVYVVEAIADNGERGMDWIRVYRNQSDAYKHIGDPNFLITIWERRIE